MQIDLIAELPPSWPCDLTPSIRQSLLNDDRTIVVLDDDPTGTQTVYDVPVLTRFDLKALIDVLRESPPVLFLLTNSRSMTADQTANLHGTLTCQLKTAAAETNRSIELISRSDSTLRGHYPLETDSIAEHWPEQAELVLLMPFFLEGGRLTIGGQHFVKEDGALIPAHETPFANDVVFGFQHSMLPLYVEEKTGGRVTAEQVISIPLDVIRKLGPDGVREILDAAPIGSVLVADGVVDSDAQVVAAAVGQSSRKVLARVAASYVRARSGLENRPLLTSAQMRGEGNGGLVVVGSHVPKTTAQLDAVLHQQADCLPVEVNVSELLRNRSETLSNVLENVAAGLESDRNVVLFTSRKLVSGDDDDSNLKIAKAVSTGLVEIVNQLPLRPRYLIAKGGITSSDIATDGLGVTRAMVVGSILPGVPVWKLGEESRFPGLHFVIFPGNVGGDDALSNAMDKLK